MRKDSLMKLFAREALYTLTTQTVVKLSGGKSNGMVGKVTKISTGIKILPAFEGVYADEMRKIDPTYTSPASHYGERIKDTPLIIGNGMTYLSAIIIDQGIATYMLDGEEIDPEDIQGFKQKEPNKTAINIRLYKLGSILSASLCDQ